MARYLFEVSIRPEAYARMIENPSDRGQALRPVFEAVGGSLQEYYFGVGEHKVYVLAEVPDHVSVEAITMGVLAGGAVTSSKLTTLLTAEEAVEAMKQAKDVGYRPPTR